MEVYNPTLSPLRSQRANMEVYNPTFSPAPAQG